MHDKFTWQVVVIYVKPIYSSGNHVVTCMTQLYNAQQAAMR
jgi:hypothetical protein